MCYQDGLSDFHRMVVTVMKTSFERLKPRVINYRDYKSFENKIFREELQNATFEENTDGFKEFIEICPKILNRLLNHGATICHLSTKPL